MPKGGDRRSGKYSEKQRTDGRYYMTDNVDELICHLTVQGESDDKIIRLIFELTEQEITVDRINVVRSSILGERRMAWLKKEKDKEVAEPETPVECIQFAKQNLIKLTRGHVETQHKIAANKALVEVAMKEKEMAKDRKPSNGNLSRLMGEE